MAKITNVLSLFDGLSCGQIALKELGVKVDKYYASEIDKHAIKQTMLNFPDTIQLGSVTDVDVSKLDKIDLLIGGSPCQSFSFAGKRKGMTTTSNEDIYTLKRYLELKRDGFEFEGQSYLFWEYMRILTYIRKYNPDVKFLLENVEMGSKWERTLSEAIGVYGVHINSALVSAQNRRRIYWTNIRTRHEGLFGELHSDIPQPEDKGILLSDILQSDVDEKYYLSNSVNYTGNNKRIIETLIKNGNPKDGALIDSYNKKYHYNKSITISTRISASDLTHVYKNGIIRKLTPTECARLQTVPDWYKWKCSDTQQYKMLGNGWTVDVIAHIFKGLKP